DGHRLGSSDPLLRPSALPDGQGPEDRRRNQQHPGRARWRHRPVHRGGARRQADRPRRETRRQGRGGGSARAAGREPGAEVMAARKESAVVVGAGSRLSAALARLFAREGMKVILAARNAAKLEALTREIGGEAFACDASKPADVQALFDGPVRATGTPSIVVYNASSRVRGPIADLDPAEVQKAIMVSCYGGFLVGQAAARLMLARGSGSIFFTGASASVKGYANSSSFAMGKFGLRGLAQSMARELAPKNIHVAHFVID